jgi:cell division transport system ATP-binding protein
LIEFTDVGLRYGEGPEILKDLSFRVEPGTFHFLTGPSGSGKTSLLRLLLLSLKPSRGRITMFGQDVSRLDRDRLLQMRRHIGIVFQEFRLLDHLT